MAEAPLVLFVGAGPGAEDLITLRGAAALETADLVVYAGSLVNPALLRRCRPECLCRDSAGLDLEAQIDLMSGAALAGKNVIRLHTGDPSLYGAIAEQIEALAERGVGAAVVPGVSSVFAAAAALRCELTLPGLSQSVVLTRTPGRTPVREEERAAAFARTGATLAFYLSAGQLDELAVSLVTEGALPPSTPAAVVYRASWEDERIVRGTLADIAGRARDAGIGRQALVLVGQVLAAQGGERVAAAAGRAASRLYSASFSHGYRNRLEAERFDGACALYAFTRRGLLRARQIADALAAEAQSGGGERHVDVYASRPDAGALPLAAHPAAETWGRYAGHIFIGAAGIAVRAVAPLLRDKTRDPAVVCCTESGSHVISLVSGHLGGANRLARRVARITGGQAVISTATDSNAVVAFDEAAAREGARIVNGEAIRALNAALLDGETVDFRGPAAVYERYFRAVPGVRYLGGLAAVASESAASADAARAAPPPSRCAVFWDAPAGEESGAEDGRVILRVTSAAFVLGLGCRRGVAPDVLEATAAAFLEEHGLRPEQVAALASCDLKADEPALLALSRKWGVPVEFHSREALADVSVPTPSRRVREKIGVPSVAEAAALRSSVRAAGRSIEMAGVVPPPAVPKTIRGDVTLALARLPHGREAAGTAAEPGPLPQGGAARRGRVVVVGLGSGSPEQITPEVTAALRRCDVAAGYAPYLDFVRDLIAGKPCIGNGMRGEVERCRAALRAALEGREVCMVCSGDPGILAMAGLLYELREAEAALADVPVLVLPGITAASLAAAGLGAPLQNGFCLVSLSDLLVPGNEVRRNLRAVAESALPVVLYNPAGRKRRALLEEALDLFAARRGEETLCALVRHAGRPEAEQWMGALKAFPRDRVDMSSLVLVGGPRTRLAGGVLYEPRGYGDKYWS